MRAAEAVGSRWQKPLAGLRNCSTKANDDFEFRQLEMMTVSSPAQIPGYIQQLNSSQQLKANPGSLLLIRIKL